MGAARFSKTLDIVEALVKAKADVNAKSNVRHLEDSRCAACILIDHACVFVAVGRHSSAVRFAILKLQIPGHRGGPGEGEGGCERDKQGEAFGG